MKRPCKTCPFVKGTKNFGADDWLVEATIGIANGSLNHTCHVTDPIADGYIGGKKRSCVGFLGMMKKFNGTCISPVALEEFASGDLDYSELPTDEVFDSPQDFVRHHARAIVNEMKEATQ